MIVSILIFLWLVLISYMLICIANRMIGKRFEYEFQNYGKFDVPYITIDIQGVPLNMIVDTGCGVSIISKSALDGLEYEESPRNISLSALTEESLNSEVVTINFKVANKEISNDFVIHHGEDFGNFLHTKGIEMHGLLGNEFLDSTSCQVDYIRHRIIFP